MKRLVMALAVVVLAGGWALGEDLYFPALQNAKSGYKLLPSVISSVEVSGLNEAHFAKSIREEMVRCGIRENPKSESVIAVILVETPTQFRDLNCYIAEIQVNRPVYFKDAKIAGLAGVYDDKNVNIASRDDAVNASYPMMGEIFRDFARRHHAANQ